MYLLFGAANLANKRRETKSLEIFKIDCLGPPSISGSEHMVLDLLRTLFR